MLGKHGVTSVPVPIEDIARAEGSEIAWKRHSGPQYGFAMCNGDRKIIGINSATSERRRREAVAHCLGHMLMHTQSLLVCHAVHVQLKAAAAVELWQEAEANAFAVALLIPAEPLVAAVAEWMTGRVELDSPIPRDALINDMARLCDVGSEAVVFRLITLGLLAA